MIQISDLMAHSICFLGSGKILETENAYNFYIKITACTERSSK